MNKIVLVFLSLLTIFCGTWIFKSKTPLNRQADTAQNLSNWWSSDDRINDLDNQVSEEWYLDPEIPENYVPVLGEDELYMVVDDNGKIVKYRRRIKQEDGTWIWQDVNPDIPDNYEPVEGLENVYKVTGADGKVHYYKYIRNDDNTFTFVEVDKNGNIIDDYIVSCENKAAADNDVPVNYSQISGNVYAVKNEDGVVVAYKEKNEDSDGSLIWSDIPESRVKQILSSPTQNKAQNQSIYNNILKDPDMSQSEPSKNVVTNQPNGGSNSGSSSGTGSHQATLPSVTTKPLQDPDIPDVSDPGVPAATTAPVIEPNTPSTTKSEKLHTQSEKYTETKDEGNFRCTYEYTIVRTYDDEGNLISTKTEGPTLIDRTLIIPETPAINRGLIESNIDNEIVRVTNGLTESSSASSVIASLNAERSNNNIPALSTGGDAQKLAVLFAADMATYDNTSSSSPMYGTISDLISRYNIPNQGYSLNIWRTTSDDAAKIHSRFQSIDSCREPRMNSGYNQIGVGIYYNNGYYYVAEVLLAQ